MKPTQKDMIKLVQRAQKLQARMANLQWYEHLFVELRKSKYWSREKLRDLRELKRKHGI